jgi:predicted SAM-dependent methyltransferase
MGLRALVKDQSTYALRTAVRDLVKQFRLSRSHVAAVKKARMHRGPGLKLNYGCGPHMKPGWVNIDAFHPGALALDAREPMPFADGAADFVYSEHFFEHLVYPFETDLFLKESYRALRSGGVFSLGVPDCEVFVRAYVTGDPQFYKELFEYKQPEWCRATRMRVVNYIFRLGDNDHKYAYDEETLALTLKDAGFVDVKRRPFDPKLDDASRKWHTLYMSAVKP